MYTIIACIGKNNELGLNNKLIWHIKEDLEFFKLVTYNHYIFYYSLEFLLIMRYLLINNYKKALVNDNSIVTNKLLH